MVRKRSLAVRHFAKILKDCANAHIHKLSTMLSDVDSAARKKIAGGRSPPRLDGCFELAARSCGEDAFLTRSDVAKHDMDAVCIPTTAVVKGGRDYPFPVLYLHRTHRMGACGRLRASCRVRDCAVNLAHCRFLPSVGGGGRIPTRCECLAVDVALTVLLPVTGSGTLRGVDGRGASIRPHTVASSVNLDGFACKHLARIDEHGESRRRRIGTNHAMSDHGALATLCAIRNPRPRGKGRRNRSGGNRSGGEERTDASDDRRERHGNLQRFRIPHPRQSGAVRLVFARHRYRVHHFERFLKDCAAALGSLYHYQHLVMGCHAPDPSQYSDFDLWVPM